MPRGNLSIFMRALDGQEVVRLAAVLDVREGFEALDPTSDSQSKPKRAE
jgi:hypothetical protein